MLGQGVGGVRLAEREARLRAAGHRWHKSSRASRNHVPGWGTQGCLPERSSMDQSLLLGRTSHPPHGRDLGRQQSWLQPQPHLCQSSSSSGTLEVVSELLQTLRARPFPQPWAEPSRLGKTSQNKSNLQPGPPQPPEHLSPNHGTIKAGKDLSDQTQPSAQHLQEHQAMS